MDTCRRLGLFFYCKRKGHSFNRCPVRQPRTHRGERRSNNTDIRATVVEVEGEVLRAEQQVCYTGPEEGEHPACYLVDVSTVGVHTATPQSASRKIDIAPNLFIQDAKIDGRAVRLLIALGATHNIITPGVIAGDKTPRMVQVRGFDGQLSPPTETTDVFATIEFGCHSFPPVQFIEWPITHDYDRILGQEWLRRSNPVIDWQKRVVTTQRDELQPISIEKFQHRLVAGHYVEIFQLRITPVRHRVTDERVQPLIARYADMFQDQLPTELPPDRDMEHEITLKPGARPHPRPGFRLSPVE